MPYQIPSKQHRTELEINRSLFVTTVAFAEEVEAAKSFIGAIRSEMPDANHHVYAYRIGFGSSVIEGMSDAGEPSGTSGPPTLAVLRGGNIGDIALVTTRYFGGTKLGTGGLVRAYTESAQLCLASLPLKLKIAKTTLTVALHYRFYDMFERMLPEFDAQIQATDFSANVNITLELPVANVESFSDQITELTNGSATII